MGNTETCVKYTPDSFLCCSPAVLGAPLRFLVRPSCTSEGERSLQELDTNAAA